jgi:D-inositol-3-phosphate glycosyltransferase
MHSILGRLADRHEIHYLGIGYSGETVRDRGLTIHPTNLQGGDVFAAFQAVRLIEEIQPHIAFILHDIWMFQHYLRILSPFRDRVKIVAYIPLDGRIVRASDAAPLQAADRVVVYTEFARAQFEQFLGPVGVIPHGVDLDRFFPFDAQGRAEAKKKVFPDLPHPAESFVVLNASRPDPRKRVDLTLEGFAIFAANKPPNVRLCLHHAIYGERERDQIQSSICRLALEDRVFVNPLGPGVLDDRGLNLLYNACDVGINTSMGEGWGLVSMEHGASGAAQIVPDHSACSELWNGRAELIPPVRNYVPVFSVLEMGEVSSSGVAEALEKLYRNPDRRRKLAESAWLAAQQPAYSWNTIAAEFERLFLTLHR